MADHGCSPDVRVANIRKFLHDSGFTVIKQGEERLERDDIREDDIDFEKTTAYLKDDKGFDIFINADPGPKFDRIERDLLVALRTWVNEEVGTTPVAIVLPRRDAYLLGRWGDECGDVIFAWDHGYVSGYFGQWEGIVGGGSAGAPKVFGAHHGGFIPTQSEVSSSFATLMLAGPGLKKAYTRPAQTLGYIHAVDIVPTFCHLLGVNPPLQSHGAIAIATGFPNRIVRSVPDYSPTCTRLRCCSEARASSNFGTKGIRTCNSFDCACTTTTAMGRADRFC